MIPNNVALRAGQCKGVGLSNNIVAAILGAAPIANPPPKLAAAPDVRGLTSLFQKATFVSCLKKDYPFRCDPESDFRHHVNRFRRVTKTCLPVVVNTAAEVCGARANKN